MVCSLYIAPWNSRSAEAAQTIPYKINFQGRLTDNSGNVLPTGLYNIKFRLYDASAGGTLQWTENRIITGSDNRIQVTNGLFNIQFGDVTALSTALFSGAFPLYLEVELPTPATATCATNGCAVFTEGPMTPRQALASAPYAFNSDSLDGLDSSAFGQLGSTQTWTGTNTFAPTTNISSLIAKQNSSGSFGQDIFAVQGSSSGNFIQVTSTAANAGAVTIQSLGSNSLTLNSGSGTIILGSSTIQRSAAGLTVDVFNAAGSSLLTFTNSDGANVANLAVEGGVSIGSSQTYKINNAQITSAALSNDSNLAKLDGTGPQTFTGDNKFTGTLLAQNSSNSTVAFQVQNLAGAALLKVDTTANNTNNLITNPSIELAIAGNWQLKGSATVTQDSSQSYIGSNSLNIAATGTGGGAKQNVTLSSTTTYSLAMYARAPSGNISSFEIGRSEDGTTDTSCLTAQTVLKNGWVRLTCSFTTGTTSGTTYIYAKQTDSTTRNIYIDAATLETDANTTTNYREGQISLQASISSPLTVQNSTNSTTAFQVLTSKGANILTVDTSDANILAGSAGFEINTLGWTYFGTPGSVQRDATTAYTGNFSLKVVTTANANNGAKLTLNSGSPSIAALALSTQYTLSWHDRLDNSSAAFTDIVVAYSPDGTGGAEVACTPSNQTVVTGGWGRHSCTFTTTATTTNSSAYLTIRQTGATAHTFYIDSVQLELGANATAYGGGNLTFNATMASPLSIRNLNDSTPAVHIQNAAGSQNLITVDTLNGRVGIGTVSPAAVLHVIGTQPAAVATSGIAATQVLQVTGGKGGNTSGTTTPAGLGSVLGLTSGAGGNATDASANTATAGAGGGLTFTAGAGGTNSSTGNRTGAAAGSVTIQGGNGGNATGSGAGASGGNILLTGGAAGSVASGTAGGAGNIVISHTSGSLASQLVLDSAATDPTANLANGAMYYNSTNNKFRCYQNTAWFDCISAGGTSTLQDVYTNSAATQPKITLNATGGGVSIQDAATPIGANLFAVQNNGATATYFGVTASAVTLQDSAGYNALVFDSVNSILKVYENVATPANFASISYASGAAIFAASSGITQIGTGSGGGNINLVLTGASDRLLATKTNTPGAAYSLSDFNFTRTVTGAGNAVTGNVLKVEDLSTFTAGGSVAPNVLYLNQNNTAATGNLILAQYGGGANDKFAVSTAGTVTIAAGQSYTSAGAVSLQSAAATALTIDSGSTGAINLGTGANAKTIIIGNTTGATAVTIQGGTGNMNIGNDGIAKTITIGNATGTTSTTLQAGTGGLVLKPITGNTTAFKLQDSAAQNYLLLDTTNNRLQVGDTTADATGVLLVLDTKNTTGDPTGVDGAMYYNSNAGKFRCFENSAWADCLGYRRLVTLGSDVINNNATVNTIADVTGLSWSVVAGTLYKFQCTISYTSAATTTGSRWSVNGPASPTALVYKSEYSLSTTTVTSNPHLSTYDLPAASNATSASVGESNIANISGFVKPSANGTFIVRFASEVASSAITAKTGSTCEWW